MDFLKGIYIWREQQQLGLLTLAQKYEGWISMPDKGQIEYVV